MIDGPMSVRRNRSARMNFSFVPLITALLPAIGVHVSYLLAAQFGHVPWCFPYIDSCTSISAVGRESPESYIFRASIIPTAIFMMVYWRLSREWLRTLPLGLLAPDIVEAILAGRQPVELTAKRLKRIRDLPVSWAEQRRVLGFA